MRYFLAHTPGLVRHGSKTSREVRRAPTLLEEITSHLRPYEDAIGYPPNGAFLGSLYPDELSRIDRPWYQRRCDWERRQPYGHIMPEEEFYGLLKISDTFDLVWLEEGLVREVRVTLGKHPLVESSDLDRLGDGRPYSAIETQVNEATGALPLHLRDGSLVGCVNRAHEDDAALTAGVLLENLACKATAAMALRTLLRDERFDSTGVEYILNSGEEAVGERYQRGGGNLAKAVGEMCDLSGATGSDIKAFCCGPVHALVIAGSMVRSGLFRQVAVVGGCSLSKLGMKFRGHLAQQQPILEDVLASIAVIVGEDDGLNPVLKLDSVGRHNIGAGSSQQAILEALVAGPLAKAGLGFRDIDKYATELHNPEITEPAGSGDVPALNYRLIGALAALENDIAESQIPGFVEAHGMPGFSPTQGHIASAVPFLGHALERMREGKMRRAMFLAKGSLFLGRMTHLSDGMSFILESNPGNKRW